MRDIVTYFHEVTGFTPTKEQVVLLLALTNDAIMKLLVSCGRGFSKTLCSAIAILWYAEKSLEDGKPINLMIVSSQDKMFEYVNQYFVSPALLDNLVKKGIYTTIPVDGFQLKNGTSVFTKHATGKVRSNRASIIFLDEAADIPEGVIKSCIGCLEGEVSRLVLISTCHKTGAYFVERCSNPDKYNYKLIQFSSENCFWREQANKIAKQELRKDEYAIDVLGRIPTKEERGTYPYKNIEKCIRDNVLSIGGIREGGLDFAFSPCNTVAFVTEKNGVRRKCLKYKVYKRKPIEEIAEDIAKFFEQFNCILIKADSHPVEYKGHIEKHTKIPIYYINSAIYKEIMIGQSKDLLRRNLLEIDEAQVDFIKQLKAHRRKMRTGDDIHDAYLFSIYEPTIPFKTKPKPCFYIDGKLIV